MVVVGLWSSTGVNVTKPWVASDYEGYQLQAMKEGAQAAYDFVFNNPGIEAKYPLGSDKLSANDWSSNDFKKHAVRVAQSGPFLPMLWESEQIVKDFPNAQPGESHTLRFEGGENCRARLPVCLSGSCPSPPTPLMMKGSEGPPPPLMVLQVAGHAQLRLARALTPTATLLVSPPYLPACHRQDPDDEQRGLRVLGHHGLQPARPQAGGQPRQQVPAQLQEPRLQQVVRAGLLLLTPLLLLFLLRRLFGGLTWMFPVFVWLYVYGAG